MGMLVPLALVHGNRHVAAVAINMRPEPLLTIPPPPPFQPIHTTPARAYLARPFAAASGQNESHNHLQASQD